MAMILCKQCRKSYSQLAVACPQCGAPNHYKPRAAVKAGYELKPWHKWAIAMVSPAWIYVMFFYGDDPPAPLPAYQPVDYDLRERTAQAQATAIMLKLSMRDPESFRVNSAMADARGRTVCIQYQARNGFGGMNQAEHITVDGNARAGWNAWCSGVGMYDMTASLR